MAPLRYARRGVPPVAHGGIISGGVTSIPKLTLKRG